VTFPVVIWPIFLMGEPLHYRGQCQSTGCVHCSRCGLGPQSTLTYRYHAGRTDELPSYENGLLCPRCASGLS